jgi:hypothetical protein
MGRIKVRGVGSLGCARQTARQTARRKVTPRWCQVTGSDLQLIGSDYPIHNTAQCSLHTGVKLRRWWTGRKVTPAGDQVAPCAVMAQSHPSRGSSCAMWGQGANDLRTESWPPPQKIAGDHDLELAQIHPREFYGHGTSTVATALLNSISQLVIRIFH